MSSRMEITVPGTSGATIFKRSLAAALMSYLPLQLYIWFGPADGNPIGLGLLAMVGIPVSLIGMAIGAIALLVQRLTSE